MMRYIPEAATALTLTAALALSTPTEAQTGGTTYESSRGVAPREEQTYGPCPSPERLTRVSTRCSNYLMNKLRASMYDDVDRTLAVATYQKMSRGELAVDGDLGPLTAKSILRGVNMNVRKPAAATQRDHLVVDKSDQVMYAVKNNRLRHVISIASGTEQPYHERGENGDIAQGVADTPTGTWRIYGEQGANYKGNLGRMPYALQYDAINGIYIHAGVVSLAGRLSHGCVRVSPQTHDTIRSEFGVGDTVTVKN